MTMSLLCVCSTDITDMDMIVKCDSHLTVCQELPADDDWYRCDTGMTVRCNSHLTLCLGLLVDDDIDVRMA